MVSSPSANSAVNFTTVPQDDFNITTTNATMILENPGTDRTALLDFVILPLIIIATVVIIVGLVAFIIRKKR